MHACMYKIICIMLMGYFRDLGKLLGPSLSFAPFDAIRTEPEVLVLIGVFMNAIQTCVVFVCTLQATTTQDTLWFSTCVILSGVGGLECVQKDSIQVGTVSK